MRYFHHNPLVSVRLGLAVAGLSAPLVTACPAALQDNYFKASGEAGSAGELALGAGTVHGTSISNIGVTPPPTGSAAGSNLARAGPEVNARPGGGRYRFRITNPGIISNPLPNWVTGRLLAAC